MAIPGRPPGWLQFRYHPLCAMRGHKPIHVPRLQLTRCERCGLALAVDEQVERKSA